MVIIMKKFNNNKGAMLVVLIIAIVLIAILGASFVSMVGSKQEGFTFLLKGHRANMIAKAGVEWAIRFASDGTDTDGNSIFFSNQTLTFTKDLVSGTTEGFFETHYDYSTDVLTVTGNYPGSVSLHPGAVSASTELSHFRRYLSPVTLVPDGSSFPVRSGTQVTIPIINNNESVNITVNQINLTVNESGKHLRQIFISTQGTPLFDFSNPPPSFPACGTPPCLDASGILLPLGASVSFNSGNGLSNHSIIRDNIVNYTLVFNETAPTGQYTLQPSLIAPAVEPNIIFTPP